MKIHNMAQCTPEWYAIRTGKPTASNAKKLVTSTGQKSKSMPDYAIELANDLYAGEPLDAWEGNQWTERGHELEDSARSLYEMINGVTTEQVGFITDDEETCGVSPDSLVGEDGLLEIKCLKATNHTKALMYFRKNDKVPIDYRSQLQMQLYVTGRKWADVMFYHPNLPELVIREYPDPEFFAVLESQLEAVAKERDNIIKLLNGG